MHEFFVKTSTPVSRMGILHYASVSTQWESQAFHLGYKRIMVFHINRCFNVHTYTMMKRGSIDRLSSSTAARGIMYIWHEMTSVLNITIVFWANPIEPILKINIPKKENKHEIYHGYNNAQTRVAVFFNLSTSHNTKMQKKKIYALTPEKFLTATSSARFWK